MLVFNKAPVTLLNICQCPICNGIYIVDVNGTSRDGCKHNHTAGQCCHQHDMQITNEQYQQIKNVLEKK